MKNPDQKKFIQRQLSHTKGLFLLRTIIGIIFLSHGIAKVITGIPPFATMLQNLGVPVPFVMAVIVIAIEIIGGAALIVNTSLVLTSVALSLNMLGALFLVHISKGWFAGSGGAEFVVLLLAGLITIAINARKKE